jgi:hypothetical protein
LRLGYLLITGTYSVKKNSSLSDYKNLARSSNFSQSMQAAIQGG